MEQPGAFPCISPRRRHWGTAVVMLVAVLLWLPRLTGPIDLRYDAGVYFLLGISLAEGHGYRIPSEPGQLEAVQYPPALPALVALHAKIFRTTDPVALGRWLRRTYFVFFVVFAASTLALARTQLAEGWAALAACLCLLQLNTYLMSDLLFSELPFALTSVALIIRLIKPGSSSQRHEAMGFALASLGFLLRSAGIALLAAWIGDAVLRRQWRLVALRTLLSLVPFGLWQAHVAKVRAAPEYQQPAYAYQRAPYQFYNVTYAENVSLVDPFRPELGKVTPQVLASRFFANVAVMPSALGEAVSTTFGFWRWGLNDLQDATLSSRPLPEGLVRIPLYVLAALACAGLIVIAARKHWALPLFVAGSVALVCATPWPGQFSRYLSPLAAFLTIATVVGALWIQHLAQNARSVGLRRSVFAFLCALVFLTAAVQGFTLVQVFLRYRYDPRMPAFGKPGQHRVFYHDRTWSAWENAVTWIGQHTPADAVVCTVAPHLCYLWTGRRAVFPPMEGNAGLARRLLEAVPVSYLIVDELSFLDITRLYGEPAVASPSSGWRVVYSVDQTRVYARDLSTQAEVAQ